MAENTGLSIRTPDKKTADEIRLNLKIEAVKKNVPIWKYLKSLLKIK